MGSTWTNTDDLTVGRKGAGSLSITDGGRVSVEGTLTVDRNTDGDGFVHMATGGVLAYDREPVSPRLKTAAARSTCAPSTRLRLSTLDIVGTHFDTLTGVTWSQGDFNGDGAVDFLDLDILSADFTPLPPDAAPEPEGLLLILAEA